MRKRTLLAVLLAVVLVVPAFAEDEHPAFPNVNFRDLEGKVHPLSELLQKATVLNFWATWCGPCRYELPELERLAESVKDRGGAILAINVDSPRPAVDAFVENTGLLLPVYLLDSRTQAALGIGRIPFTVLLDGEGRVVRIYQGYSEDGMQDLRQQLDALLPKPRGQGGKSE